jgi:hypothetical protein
LQNVQRHVSAKFMAAGLEYLSGGGGGCRDAASRRATVGTVVAAATAARGDAKGHTE